ncbi:MAG: SEL1-like repeat protein [Prevotella sp.]
MTALLASCSDLQLMDEASGSGAPEFLCSSVPCSPDISTLLDRARWGDSQACLQLANCYKDGIGVKRDYLGVMCMVGQACLRSGMMDAKDMKEYLVRMADDSDLGVFISVADMGAEEIRTRRDSIWAQMEAMDNSDVLAMYGVASMESGDTIGGREAITMAAERGSSFGVLMNTVLSENGEMCPRIDKLEQIAERVPLAYTILASLCLDPGHNDNTDKRKIAEWLMKADEHALLSGRGARWLLEYYRSGGDVSLSDEDVMRLGHITCSTAEEEAGGKDSKSEE